MLACVPLLWSRVLFPGTCLEATRPRWLSSALLLLLPGVLLYPCISFHLLEPDEGRYAEIPREMLARGDWVVPHLQSEPYLDKPPLLYWLVMLSYSVFGVNEAAARLVRALAVHLTILCVYLIGRRSLGERAALWGALFLAVAPGCTTLGRLLILDGLLTGCTTVAILAAFEALRGERLRWRWWLLAAAATGLGILTKGPVALILLAPPLWLFRRLQPQRCPLGWKPLAAFAVLLLALNLPWYIAMSIRMPGFLKYFFWKHNVERFLQPFDHLRPIWFYLPVLLAALLPGTLLAFGFLRFLFSGDPRRTVAKTPAFGFMLLAGGWCVCFFSLSGSKLPTYILPAFPLLALAFGVYIAKCWPHRPVVPAALLGLGFVALTVVHVRLLPWYAQQRSPLGEPAAVVQHCADQPIVCFPRSCESVGFYLKRDDLRVAQQGFRRVDGDAPGKPPHRDPVHPPALISSVARNAAAEPEVCRSRDVSAQQGERCAIRYAVHGNAVGPVRSRRSRTAVTLPIPLLGFSSPGRFVMMRAVSRFAALFLLAVASSLHAEAPKIQPDVVYGHKDGMALTFDLFRPEKPNGTLIIWVQSGGWYSVWIEPKQMLPVTTPLTAKGYTVCVVRHGSAPKYAIPEAAADMRRSVRYIRLHAKDWGVDPERIGVIGGSAGGHLTLVLATTADDGDPKSPDEVLRQSDRIAAAVAFYPPTDIRTWVTDPPDAIKNVAALMPPLTFDPAKAADFSPLIHVSAATTPTLLIHGDKDPLVPIEHSRNMIAALEKAKVPSELLVIEGTGHGFNAQQNQTKVAPALIAWFDKYLAAKTEK